MDCGLLSWGRELCNISDKYIMMPSSMGDWYRWG